MTGINEEFYIGWQDKMPKGNSSYLKRILIILIIAIPIISFILVRAQKPFNNFVFDFGNIKEYTGIYHQTPVPALRIN